MRTFSPNNFIQAFFLSSNTVAWLFVIGMLGSIIFDFPFPIQPAQILALFISGELLWRYLGMVKPFGPKKTVLFSGLLIALLAYINFLWFFLRVGIEPSGLGSENLVYDKATTLAALTVMLCFIAFLLQYSMKRPVTNNRIRFKKGSLKIAGLSALGIILLVYMPVVQSIFSLSPLSAADWSSAILTAMVFVLLTEVRSHMAHHSRKAVYGLHPKLRD